MRKKPIQLRGPNPHESNGRRLVSRAEMGEYVTRFLLEVGPRLFEVGLQRHRESRMLTGWAWRIYYRRKALTQTAP